MTALRAHTRDILKRAAAGLAVDFVRKAEGPGLEVGVGIRQISVSEPIPPGHTRADVAASLHQARELFTDTVADTLLEALEASHRDGPAP